MSPSGGAPFGAPRAGGLASRFPARYGPPHGFPVLEEPSHLAGLVCLGVVALGAPAGLLACWPTTGGSTGSSGTSAAPAGTGTTDPPVIQSLDMDSSALTPVSDMYTIFGTITYEDDDDKVTAFKVYVPVLGKTYTFTVDNPQSTGYGQPIEFTLSADPPLGGAGPTNYELSLVNSSGSVSTAVEKSMDLE